VRFLHHMICFIIEPPLPFPLFPYTTLFRSKKIHMVDLPLGSTGFRPRKPADILTSAYATGEDKFVLLAALANNFFGPARKNCLRSEEHTSELQSRFDLVCRLLLEKKNIGRESLYPSTYYLADSGHANR